jgi:hypothetical protein
MTTHSMKIRQLAGGAAAVLFLLGPAAAAAEAGPVVTEIVDRPHEQRLLIAVGPIAPAAGGSVVTVRAPLPRGVMLYRFAAELVDAGGAPVGDVAWRAAVSARRAAAVAMPLVRLSASERAVLLSRPFGFRLEAGDSILIELEIPDLAAHGHGSVVLEMSIGYESLGGAVSRMAVLAYEPENRRGKTESGSQGAPAGRSWEWRSVTEGRIVTIAGVALHNARELVIEDVQAGTVVWRLRAGESGGPEFRRPDTAVRPGIVVEPGRIYRLTIIAESGARLGGGPHDESLLVLVVPCRRPSGPAEVL